MVDITHKTFTHRKAVANAIVKVSAIETIRAIETQSVPKGNVFEIAKAAGLLAIKNTANTIPDCHPLPIEYAQINYDINELSIHIRVEVHTIYKTGVEVEAMHGAAIVALTLYDMLKPIDQGITIQQIGLLEKKGGKSDVFKQTAKNIKIAVVVCSDSISAGKKTDRAGKAIITHLEKLNLDIQYYHIIPDEAELIREQVNYACNQHFDVLIFTGGTGLSARDITPETIIPLLDRRIPGAEEAIRHYGQSRTPYAMLSRSVVGIKDRTLIMALPGSTKGATESVQAVFPSILHVLDIQQGANHD